MRRTGQITSTPKGQDGGEYKAMRARSISRKLHARGVVGNAFKALCVAGCDQSWLETTLCSLPQYPLEYRRKAYTVEERKRLERIIANLKFVASELRNFQCGKLYLTNVRDWPFPPETLPSIVEDLANKLEQSTTTPQKWMNLRTWTGYDRIPHLVDKVRASTGKPHYRELATLIAAAYDQPEFSEDRLKTLVARRSVQRLPKQAK
jgi:hypothetical protein